MLKNKKKTPCVHPGKILHKEFMKPIGLTNYRLAKEIQVSPQRIGDIINGKRAISTETALKLSHYFSTSKEYWLNLQIAYDLKVAKKEIGKQINQEVRRNKKINIATEFE